MKRCLGLCAAVLAVLSSGIAAAQLGREVVGVGLNFPLHVAAPPGDAERIFVVERAGVIRIIALSGNIQPTVPFLDLRDVVDVSGEGALYSIAFHPEYVVNGYFFVFYTTDIDPDDDFRRGIRVSRFTVSDNPEVADRASETVFLEIRKPSAMHNGGMIAFRPGDASHFLYISTGDGSDHCDPSERAQDIGELFGKILRIDVDRGPGPKPDRPYVPAGNPYAAISGNDAIWCLGLRNPFRFSFDRATGDMYIGDVGQGSREEINLVPAASAGGENFGWHALEGTISPPACEDAPRAEPGMVPPLYEYDHNGRGASVTGGHVYRGSEFPELEGRYFFGDFVTRRVWSFIPAGNAIADLQEHTAALNPLNGSITGFGEGGTGELYMTDRQGTVARIVAPPPPPADADQDLLPDGYENNTGVFVNPEQTGTDPLDYDTDDDGVWDGIETLLGTDPHDPFDFPELPAGSAVVAIAALLLAAGYTMRRDHRRS